MGRFFTTIRLKNWSKGFKWQIPNRPKNGFGKLRSGQSGTGITGPGLKLLVSGFGRLWQRGITKRRSSTGKQPIGSSKVM
jgi:hypothetical protein